MNIILVADLHFRPDRPRARTDDYMATQTAKMEFIQSTAIKYNAMILSAGDVVHRPRERKEPVTFVNYLLDKLPQMSGILGNHDLHQHSADFLHHTTMGTLIRANKYDWLREPRFMEDTVIYPFNWEEPITKPEKLRKCTIAVYHGMVTEKVDPFLTGYIGSELLAEFPEYDLILTGDNHKQFVIEKDGRFLVNPGSLKRDNADQVDHEPKLYLYDTVAKTLKEIPIPVEKEVISRDHLVYQEERDARLEAVVETYQAVGAAVSLDVEDTFKQFFQTQSVPLDEQNLIQSWMEKE